MNQRTVILILGAAAGVAWAAAAGGSGGDAGAGAGTEDHGAAPRVAAGEPLPSLGLRRLGGRLEDPLWRPEEQRGRRPVLLLYWSPGSRRSREMLDQSRELLRSVRAAGVEVLAVAVVEARQSEAAIMEVAREMKIDVPVMLDPEGRMARALGLGGTRSLALADREGVVRLAGAAHFRHEVAPGLSFETYLRRGMESGTWPTVEAPAPYEPAVELVGRPYVDFTLPDIVTLEEKRLSRLMEPGRFTLLVVWSITSPGASRILPEIARWHAEGGKDALVLVSVAASSSPEMRRRTTDFMLLHKLRFPVLMDGRLELKPLYRFADTPVAILIRPDGAIDAVASGPNLDVTAFVHGRGVPSTGSPHAAGPAGSGVPHHTLKPRSSALLPSALSAGS